MKAIKLYEKTLLIEEFVETICFIILFFTIIIQVIFRLKPIAMNMAYNPCWTDELSRWLFVYIVFFGASRGIYYKEHIKINNFLNLVPETLKNIITCIIDLLMLLCAVTFIYYGIKSMPFLSKQYSLTLPFTTGVLYAVVPISFSLMALRILVVGIQDVIYLKQKLSGDI